MGKPKADEAKAGAPEWMATYGDLVTLLLCFFVLLFAFSTVDAKKFEQLASSLSGSPISVNTAGGKSSVKDLFGNGIMQMPALKVEKKATESETQKAQAQAMEELKQMSSDFKTYFAENNVSEQVKVEIKDNELVLTFADGLLFDSGSADLKKDSLKILDLIVAELIKYPKAVLMIEGHTDNRPIKTVRFPSNWFLSSARAISVGTYFINIKGFPPNSVAAIGRGEFLPVATNDTNEGRSKNRRVEIKVRTNTIEPKNTKTYQNASNNPNSTETPKPTN